MSIFKKSFEQWCKENGMEIYLKYWDYEINGFAPSEIGYGSRVKVAFKCDDPNHPVFYKRLNDISRNKNTIICPACSSIGRYIIDTKGKEYMDAIWSEKNEKSYYEYIARSSKKIWLRCLNNENHPDYDVTVNTLYIGCGCPYCTGKKICYENSLANSIPEIIDIWSDKNEKQPDEYSAYSGSKVWLKCQDNKHEDFQRVVGNIQTYGYRCPKCVKEEQNKLQTNDLTGRTFGRLTVLGIDPDDDRRNGIRYICQCSCENHTIKSILGSHLTSGKIQSCGCLWHEKISGENNWLWKGGVSSYNKRDDERTCICCGRTYNFMPYFNPYKRLPMWKERFDSQICKDVYEIVSDYQSGVISRKLAKQKLSDLDLTDMTFIDNIQFTIDEIFETTDNKGFEKILYRPGRGVPEKMVANLF